jgi:hypothetical protein
VWWGGGEKSLRGIVKNIEIFQGFSEMTVKNSRTKIEQGWKTPYHNHSQIKERMQTFPLNPFFL